MKAKVFLVHNSQGYQCEVFFSDEALKERVETFVRIHATKSGRKAFLLKIPLLKDDPAKLANEYGIQIKDAKDRVAMTVLDAEVGDPENFNPES